MRDVSLAYYERLFGEMTIRPEHEAAVDSIATRIQVHLDRYKEVERRTGAPWRLVAALHYRESDLNFNTWLANGDPLGQVSTHVPRGYNVPADWVLAAVMALNLDGASGPWPNVASQLKFSERFNGYGYANKGFPSPYVWSFSNHYAKGKYSADGVYNPAFVDKQAGIAPILYVLGEAQDNPAQPEIGIHYGDKSEAVVRLQKYLNNEIEENGNQWTPLREDGKYGDKTKAMLNEVLPR